VAFEAQNRAQDTATDFALRIIRVERELMLRRLRRVGIQVVDWQVDQPFDKVMRLSLVRPMAQTRIVRIER